MDTFTDEYVHINQTIVHVRQYGFSETLLPPQKDCTVYNPKIIQRLDPPLVVIFTPGNPGIISAYHDFITHLRSSSATHNNNNPLPVITISHNNVDQPIEYNQVHTIRDYGQNGTRLTVGKTIQDPYQVSLQIRNKIVLIKKMLDLSKTKVILIGHSVGCYITIRMMDEDEEIRNSTTGVVLIHPTFENIKSSPNGQYWNQVFSYKADWLFSMCALVLSSVMPTFLKKYIASRRCGENFRQLSPLVQDGLIQVMEFKPMQAMVSMAKSEFECIKDMNIRELLRYSDRLRLIYAKQDLWVNEEHKNQILKCPLLKSVEYDAKHAFILDPETTQKYADIVGRYISEFKC